MFLRLSTSRRIDGLWVGVLEDNRNKDILRRVEGALALVKIHDRDRYDRMLRGLERVWVHLLPGNVAGFNVSLRACELDTRFVVEKGSQLEIIASAIVHECTHARLWRGGIGYAEEQRHRVEGICIRRELAFAAKLPNGQQLREWVESRLRSPLDLTDAAFAQRRETGTLEVMRHVGIPEWLVRAVLALRALRLGILRFATRLALPRRS
jgi:hypothetical protein